MQWDKFSTDAEDSIERLENELLVAAADHINDKLYYTLAPLHLEVKSDYFTEGVKLYASFGSFDKEENEAELNVTMPSLNVTDVVAKLDERPAPSGTFELTAKFTIADKPREKRFQMKANDRLSVGRGGTNNLILDDVSVSKMHASLSINADGLLSVADTGSTNGTLINGQRIAYGKAVVVSTEDMLKFGTVEVKLELERHEPEPPPESEAQIDGATSVGGLEFRSGADTPPDDKNTEHDTPEESTRHPQETETSSQLGVTTERMDIPTPEAEEESA
jgi:pSer/pThr/pTyr-binding forkhead associated (FHA) protein